jgi:hypothetical protein
MGAALATLVAFMVRCWYINYSASRLFDMQLPWRRIVFAGLLSVAAVLVSMLGPHSLVAGLVFDICVMLVFGVLFFAAPILSPEIRYAVINGVFHPKSLAAYFK